MLHATCTTVTNTRAVRLSLGKSRSGEGGNTSLADWAEQLGQSDMLAALSASTSASASTSPTEANGSGTPPDTGGATAEGDENGGERGWGGGEMPDDVELFVEELRVRKKKEKAWAA